MLGHRGCRLAVTYPEILEMQVTAITEAVIACKQKKIDAQAEIMIPLVGTARELATLAEQVRQTMADVQEKKKYKGKLDITVGTMIEVPRACVVADEIGEIADFFSFGTNDLTQMTFGFSRDDINTFLPDYLKQEILLARPVPIARYGRRRPAGRDGRPQRPRGEDRPQVRHLRRARRRPGLDPVLPEGRAGLRLVQPVPRADRAAGRRPGGTQAIRHRHRPQGRVM